MELIREALVDFVQAEPFAPIHVRVGKNAKQGPITELSADLQYGGESSDSTVDDQHDSSDGNEV
jgi:hypothetical protein